MIRDQGVFDFTEICLHYQMDDSKIKKGVVIFLDALGVKHLGIDKSREFIKKREKFIERIKFIRDKRAEEFKRDLNIVLPDPEIAVFQDSIIICWEEHTPTQEPDKYHFSFFHAAGQWLRDAINCAIGMGFFFRGSISQGEYIFDTSEKNVTVIGPAIDDAHDYYEQADWIGVIQTQDCKEKYLSNLKSIAEKENRPLEVIIEYYQFLFVLCHIPLHREKNNIETVSKETFFAVSWPHLTCQIEKKGGDKIFKILLDESKRPKNRKFKSKYDNSLAFAKWYKTNKFIPRPR